MEQQEPQAILQQAHTSRQYVVTPPDLKNRAVFLMFHEEWPVKYAVLAMGLKPAALYKACQAMEREDEEVVREAVVETRVAIPITAHVTDLESLAPFAEALHFPDTRSHEMLLKFLGDLDRCKHTMDVCASLISCTEITSSMISAKRHRQVDVRVIVEYDQIHNTGSQIRCLVKNGIEV